MSRKNSFLIKEASSSDIQLVLPLYVNFYNELRAKQGWNPASIEEYKEDVEMILKRDKVFIAYHNDLGIGFVRISRRDGAFWIEELYVEKNYRNLKVGRKLVEKAEEYIRKFEISVYIMVLPQDIDAMNFWIKMGYNMLNSIELVKDFQETKRSLKPRVITILGYSLKLAKWSYEKYTDEQLEYLEAIDNFFKTGGTIKTYLKLVTKVLREYSQTRK